jgi:hypothetical protein
VKIVISFLFVLIGLAGCGGHSTHNFSALGSVTSISVKGSDPSHPSTKITDGGAITEIVAFVDAHRNGWDVPWSGVPVPIEVAEFYSGTEFKGSFGVGRDFLETQRDGRFFSQSATSSEVSSFLKLLTPQADSPVVSAAGILDGDFEIVTSVNRLPTSVRSAFAVLARQSSFEMADPGQNFQATDFIAKTALPWRRLIFAGISAEKCFLHYERGGRGHSYYLVVFTTEPTGAKFFWGTALPNPSMSLADLKASAYAALSLSGNTTRF